MKWENYNKMTNEDKEEYIYRFKDDNLLTDHFELKYLIIIFFILGIVTAVSGIIILNKDNITEKEKTQLKTAINLYLIITKFIVSFLVFAFILNTYFYIDNCRKKNKWLEEKGYKYIFAKQK